MLKKTIYFFAVMAFIANCFAGHGVGPVSRSVCPPCPINSAQFCNVCASTGRFENLVVESSVTLCPGVELPCFCCYNDEIQVNALGMQSSDIEQSVSRFNPIGLTYVVGWAIEPSADEPSTITTQFAVPFDFDPAVDPTITLHYIINNSNALLHRAPDSVNFQVGATFAGNGDDLDSLTPTTFDTGDLSVSTTVGTFHYQVNIPVSGVTLNAGNFAYISVDRIATTEDVEYDAPAYLAEIVFSYRKLAC